MKHHTPRTTTIPLSAAAIAAAVLAVAALVFANTRDRFFGAPLSFQLAKDGATVASSFLPFAGTARHARELLVNGRSIALGRDGAFSDALLLSPGYNAVEVALRDQFGNQSVRTYHLVFKPLETVTTAAAMEAVESL